MKITPYSSNIILDSPNRYGIMESDPVFRFTPNRGFARDNSNSTEPVDWSFYNDSIKRRAFGAEYSRSLNPSTLTTSPPKDKRSKKSSKTQGKKHDKKGAGKLKKCFFKLIKGGKKKGRGKKKYMMPLVLGLLAAKSLLIAVALKALAFISAKGLMMGLFSTMMASVLSLKGMFDHSHAWNRKDDAKTQVEIIQVPTKSNEHVYYDEHYKRGDYTPWQIVK